MTNDCHYCYNSLFDDKLFTGKTTEMFNYAHLHLCTFISALTSLSFRFVLLSYFFFVQQVRVGHVPGVPSASTP